MSFINNSSRNCKQQRGKRISIIYNTVRCGSSNTEEKNMFQGYGDETKPKLVMISDQAKLVPTDLGTLPTDHINSNNQIVNDQSIALLDKSYVGNVPLFHKCSTCTFSYCDISVLNYMVINFSTI